MAFTKEQLPEVIEEIMAVYPVIAAGIINPDFHEWLRFQRFFNKIRDLSDSLKALLGGSEGAFRILVSSTSSTQNDSLKKERWNNFLEVHLDVAEFMHTHTALLNECSASWGVRLGRFDPSLAGAEVLAEALADARAVAGESLVLCTGATTDVMEAAELAKYTGIASSPPEEEILDADFSAGVAASVPALAQPVLNCEAAPVRPIPRSALSFPGRRSRSRSYGMDEAELASLPRPQSSVASSSREGGPTLFPPIRCVLPEAAPAAEGLEESEADAIAAVPAPL